MLLHGFVNFVIWICQSCYSISHPFPSQFFESFADQKICLNFLLLLLFCSRDKKTEQDYACYAPFVSLRSFFIVFVCKSPGIVSVRKKERPSSSSSSHGRFVTLSVFLRLFACNFSQPLCTFSKMIFLTGKLSQE